MAISYKKLWKMLIDKDMKKKDLMLISGVSQSSVTKMGKNENIVQESIKEVKKGNYIIGTIGAIIGGAVASIPWILVYSFANMIVAALALLITGGAFLGYKLLKGKIGKGFPVIIAIVSIIVVTAVTLIVCPIIFMAKEGVEFNIFNFKMVYSSNEMKGLIIRDLIVSLLFTGLGIASVVRDISIQIKKGTLGDKLQINTNTVIEEKRKEIQEKVSKIKEICKLLNCMDKEKAATKQEIMNELEMTHKIERKKAKQYFATVKETKILRKHKGKYYYDETDEQVKILDMLINKESVLKISLEIGVSERTIGYEIKKIKNLYKDYYNWQIARAFMLLD